MPASIAIQIQFNEPVDGETLGQVTLSANGIPVSLSSYLKNGNQLLALAPTDGLYGNTLYTLTIAGVTDLAGNPINPPVTSTFATSSGIDFSVPTVSSVIPENGATGVLTNTTVQIQFSKLMNALTISSSTFTLSSGTILIGGTVSVTPDATLATFTPNASLAPLTTYTVQAASGIAGNSRSRRGSSCTVHVDIHNWKPIISKVFIRAGIPKGTIWDRLSRIRYHPKPSSALLTAPHCSSWRRAGIAGSAIGIPRSASPSSSTSSHASNTSGKLSSTFATSMCCAINLSSSQNSWCRAFLSC